MDKMKSQNSVSISRNSNIYHDVQVEKIIPGGDGLVRMKGKVIFIPGVIGGEIIDFKIVSEGKKFSRGSVIRIKESSENRVLPFCPVYEICGGCNMQHLSYEYQISLKESFVKEHFKRLAGIGLPENFKFLPSKPQHYRNRIQLHRGEEGCGFKMRSSDDVIPLTHCPVLVDSLNDFLSAKENIVGTKETFYGLEERYYRESGQEDIRVLIGDHPVHFRADLFFQSNLSLIPELLNFSLNGYKGQHGMDLYCGVGLFSVFMKERFSEITAIELNPKTEMYYRKNMAGASYHYFAMSLEDWVKKKSGPPADLIVVDPPRTGLSAKVRSHILKMNVPDLVYVSCDPVTQARDTKDLLEGGYEISAARGFDFYPQTAHMETVLRFRKR
ncbi:class I SAM-dependent RNA methyltransferase [Oceanispirochaeta crateris]|uniref:Class I SAM-dependent RNA methyltransferase n=1 Tax=Oceanispirochaeta crateris TaxID=2518645 RepID=A0A5C1QL84_9SPIO|nr:class I SAM-dependent RNA methyltransferase [Oceanispirochaeta crateris]QEN07296.1 class I SAM-dependent RNA methyltransferase [Oceanispirochaeta crateris]